MTGEQKDSGPAHAREPAKVVIRLEPGRPRLAADRAMAALAEAEGAVERTARLLRPVGGELVQATESWLRSALRRRVAFLDGAGREVDPPPAVVRALMRPDAPSLRNKRRAP